MSNIKISDLTVETSLSNIEGLAGYIDDNGTLVNRKISGASIIAGTLQIGNTSTTALAGDTTTITTAQANAISTNTSDIANIVSFPGFGTTSTTALKGNSDLQDIVNNGNEINNKTSQNNTGTIRIVGGTGNYTTTHRIVMGDLTNFGGGGFGVLFNPEGATGNPYKFSFGNYGTASIGYSGSTETLDFTKVSGGTANLSFGSGIDVEFNNSVEFNNGFNIAGALKLNNNSGNSGQVLTSTGAGSPQWEDPLPSPLFQDLQGGVPTSGTKDWDFNLGYNAELFVQNANGTSLTVSNWTDGDSGVLILQTNNVQSGTGASFSFPTNSVFPGGTPTIEDGKTYVFNLIYKSSTELIWTLMSTSSYDLSTDTSSLDGKIKLSSSLPGSTSDTVTLTGAGTVSVTSDNAGEVTITGASGIDFSGLNISTIKADLSNSTQNQYGEAITVKASAAIDNGAVVIWDYSGAEVQAKMPSGSTPDQHEIIGIAIEDIAAGSTGKVLIYGYATAKYDPSGVVVSSLPLNSGSTGGTTVVGDTTERTTFTDDGGTGSNYSNGVNYTHTFSNVNGGNISMKFISWSIEQGSSNIWDRLGFTVSNDGVTYQNAEFTPHTTSDNGGWRTSGTTTAPWSSTEGTAGPNNSGYILASDPGTNFPVNAVIDTGYPYVRAYFESDSSASEAGWEIEVYGQNALSGAPSIGQGAYININDLTEVSRVASTGRTLGTFVGTDITNDAVVMFVAPARPQIS